jgi:hypothetical protein
MTQGPGSCSAEPRCHARAAPRAGRSARPVPRPRGAAGRGGTSGRGSSPRRRGSHAWSLMPGPGSSSARSAGHLLVIAGADAPVDEGVGQGIVAIYPFNGRRRSLGSSRPDRGSEWRAPTPPAGWPDPRRRCGLRQGGRAPRRRCTRLRQRGDPEGPDGGEAGRDDGQQLDKPGQEHEEQDGGDCQGGGHPPPPRGPVLLVVAESGMNVRGRAPRLQILRRSTLIHVRNRYL